MEGQFQEDILMFRPRRPGEAQQDSRYRPLKVLLLIVLVFSCDGQGARSRREEPARSRLEGDETRAILERARGGDVLLRRGKGLVSELIASSFAGSGGWSHCALVVTPEVLDGIADEAIRERIGFGETLEQLRKARLLVIHSVDEGLSEVSGVQIQSLEDFCRYSVPGTSALYRPRITEETRRDIQVLARQMALEGVPFDRNWDARERDTQYCSEFLWRLFDDSAPAPSKDWVFVGGIVAFTNFSDPEFFDAVTK